MAAAVRVLAAALIAVSLAAHAEPAAQLRLAGTLTLDEGDLPDGAGVPATHRLALVLLAFRDTAWTPSRIIEAARAAAPLLAQCGIRLAGAELRELEGGEPELRDLFTPVARQLVRRLQPAKPAVFFVRGTRNQPAFEGEAFGRGNTKTRPELAGTVWLTEKSRDLPVALAHELAHVLMDSGAHPDEPGNLMREDTAPGNTRLSPAQCEQMRVNGTANGWLEPVLRPPQN